MRKYESHVSFEQLSGEYTKEDMVMLLSDFQDEMIRDYRARFGGSLTNRKYFARSLEQTPRNLQGQTVAEAQKFRELVQDLDALGNTITTLRNEVIREERVMRALNRTLPGEELIGAYDVVLCDGRERAEYDAVVVTPYGAFVIIYAAASGTIDADGFMHAAGVHKASENLAYTTDRKVALLKRKLKKYKALPVYALILRTDPGVMIKDKYKKIEITSIAEVLSDIREKSEGKRFVSQDEMNEITGMLKRAGEQDKGACSICRLDLRKIADEYAWFAAECSKKEETGLIGRIRKALWGNMPEKPETEIA